MNVTSNTERLVHIPKGNRGPRKPASPGGPRATTEILERMKAVLEVAPETNVFMRRSVFACDRQRFYRMRDLLVKLGYVTVGPRPDMVWTATHKLASVRLADIFVALEPQFAASNTAPGYVQVDCPLCGLHSRPWADRTAARRWYFDVHIHNSIGHR